MGSAEGSSAAPVTTDNLVIKMRIVIGLMDHLEVEIHSVIGLEHQLAIEMRNVIRLMDHLEADIRP